MKLTKRGENGYTLTDELGNSIQVDDDDELCEAYVEIEKVLGAPDVATRYRLLERKIDKLMKTVEEMKACL